MGVFLGVSGGGLRRGGGGVADSLGWFKWGIVSSGYAHGVTKP